MDITGLTGHSGSGKTTTARIMSDLGFYHIDCDRIVHEKVYTEKAVLDKIKDVFGDEYVTDGVLQRRKLGALVFSDKNAYNKLMGLVRDEIIKKVEFEIAQNSDRHILLDAPTLFEFGMENRCTRTIGVISSKSLERICERDHITQDEALHRLENQKSADFFRQNCDIIIENDSGFDSLCKRITEISNTILKGQNG